MFYIVCTSPVKSVLRCPVCIVRNMSCVSVIVLDGWNLVWDSSSVPQSSKKNATKSTTQMVVAAGKICTRALINVNPLDGIKSNLLKT